MTSGQDGGGIPSEMKEKLASFDTALTSLETELKPLLAKPRMEFFEKLEPLDMGKMDLVASYAVNSLFWMYLNVCGINPKDHAIKQELERVRGYMNRVKEIQDKAKAPKVNSGAAKRMVKSALWQAAQKKVKPQGRDEAGPSQSHSSIALEGTGRGSLMMLRSLGRAGGPGDRMLDRWMLKSCADADVLAGDLQQSVPG